MVESIAYHMDRIPNWVPTSATHGTKGLLIMHENFLGLVMSQARVVIRLVKFTGPNLASVVMYVSTIML